MKFMCFCLVLGMGFLCAACQTETAVDVDLKTAAEMNASLAVQYTRQKAFPAAEEKLELASLQDKNSVHVQLAWAYFYQATQQSALAENAYAKALALSPDDPEVWNNDGAFLCGAGRYREAMQRFSFVIKHGNYVQRSEALNNQAICQKMRN